MTYIFDFDGTLVDSMPYFSNLFINALKEKGVKYPDDIVKIITPLGYLGAAKYCIELGLDYKPEELVPMLVERIKKEYFYNIPAKDFVTEKLRELKNNNHSLNVLTASPHAVLDACLKRLEIFELFDNVWSCDDFNTSKSDPDIYRRAAEKLGTTVDSCTFLDDNIHSLETAKKAGMKVVGVYDKSSDDMIEEMKKISDKYIFDFREL